MSFERTTLKVLSDCGFLENGNLAFISNLNHVPHVV